MALAVLVFCEGFALCISKQNWLIFLPDSCVEQLLLISKVYTTLVFTTLFEVLTATEALLRDLYYALRCIPFL